MQSVRSFVGMDVHKVPGKPGERIKTDRRDSQKLAILHRSGDLTKVWVPDEGSEALRDLVRAREAAKQDELRVRHRLGKFLLRSVACESVDKSDQKWPHWLDLRLQFIPVIGSP